jgi:hypothetical protein
MESEALLIRHMETDKDKVIAVLKAKKVPHRVPELVNVVDLLDGTFGVVHFNKDGKLVGCSRTVKAALAKHINKAVY